MFGLWFAPIVCGSSLFGLCFDMQYTVSFLVLQTCSFGRESWWLYFIFLMSFDCSCSVALPHGAMGWSALFGCGISCPYLPTFFLYGGSVVVDKISCPLLLFISFLE